jgi:hypothetical protein
LYFFIFVFIFLVLDDKGVILGIQANGEATVLIDLCISGLLLDLFEAVLPEEELFTNEQLEFLLSLLHGHVLVEDCHSLALDIVDIKVLLTIVGVDRIQLKEVLLPVGHGVLNVP